MVTHSVGRQKTLGLGLLCALSSSLPGDCRFESGPPHVVVIREFQFRPAVDTVRIGETVVWKNQDIVPHTATSDTRRFDSKTIDANGSWRLVAKKKGRLSYYCALHPTMKGIILVR